MRKLIFYNEPYILRPFLQNSRQCCFLKTRKDTQIIYLKKKYAPKGQKERPRS